MPIFEYICQECDHRFETIVFGKEKARCPKCESTKLAPQLSVFAVASKSGGHAASSGPCGSCGDPRGPGSCAMRDFN
jgi:putative FmdB family regulatory protein